MKLRRPQSSIGWDAASASCTHISRQAPSPVGYGLLFPINTESPLEFHGSAHSSSQCIYAMHRRVIFAVGDNELEDGVDRLAIVIERQISYFADLPGLDGFFKYLGDNPCVRIFEVTKPAQAFYIVERCGRKC